MLVIWKPDAGHPTSALAPANASQAWQIVVQQIANPFDADIRCWLAGENLRVMGVMPLPGENGGHSRSPTLFDSGEDTQLIVHQHVMFRGIPSLNVRQLVLFVDVNENV